MITRLQNKRSRRLQAREQIGAKGFTLIEMLVVIALIAIITVMIVPGISSYFQVSINGATRDIGTTVKEAYNSTVLTGRVYRIVYDIKKNQYWVESGPPNVLLDTAETLKKAEEDNFGKIDDDDKPKTSVFSMDQTITRHKVSLPRGVTFEDVVTQQSPKPIKDGLAYTHFFPHGFTEQTIIHLKDSSTHHASLVISPLVGNTDVYSRYITLEEAFGKK